MSVVFQTDFNGALEADGGNYISQSGVYSGEIKRFTFESSQNGAKFVNIAFETDNGVKTDFLKVYYKQNNGNEHYEKRRLDSLFALLGIPTVSYAKRMFNGREEFYSPEVEGGKITVSLQRKEYLGNDGKVKYKFNIKHFLDYATKKTYKELTENTEAKTAEFIYEPITVKPSSGTGNAGGNRLGGGVPSEDDLPF